MDFALSSQLVNRLDYVSSTGSTNTDLIAAAAEREDLSVLVAGYQSAGRGRSTGRLWVAPEGSSLAVSVLLRPALW
jgi:BirA family biotin operon repressor/biotin-[acetyl-CoA-carboxylase] ligase